MYGGRTHSAMVLTGFEIFDCVMEAFSGLIRLALCDCILVEVAEAMVFRFLADALE